MYGYKFYNFMYKRMSGGVCEYPHPQELIESKLDRAFQEKDLDGFIHVLEKDAPDFEWLFENGNIIFQAAYDRSLKTGDRRFLEALLHHGAIGVAREEDFMEEEEDSTGDCVVFMTPQTEERLLSIIPGVWSLQSDPTSKTDTALDKFIMTTIEKMKIFCANPRWKYPSEENARVLGHKSLDDAYKALNRQYLNQLGLKINGARLTASRSYPEKGNHAEVFRRLFSSKHTGFLILECALALHLAELWAYLDIFGDKLFNEFIQDKFDGKPKIIPGKPATPNEDELVVRSNISFPEGTHLSKVTKLVQKGDLVYIEGVRNYTLFHPDGTARGLNALAVEDPDSGEIKFIGFHDNDATPRSYSEVIASLRKCFFENITYAELHIIVQSAEILTHKAQEGSSISFAEVRTLLEEENERGVVAQEIATLQQKKDNGLPLDVATSLRVPEKDEYTPVGLNLIGRVLTVAGLEEDEMEEDNEMDTSKDEANEDVCEPVAKAPRLLPESSD